MNFNTLRPPTTHTVQPPCDLESLWDIGTAPNERHQLLTYLFDQILYDNGNITSVKPNPAFARYLQTHKRLTFQVAQQSIHMTSDSVNI